MKYKIISCDKYVELFVQSLKNLLTSEDDKERNDTQFTYLYLNHFGIVSLLDVNSDEEFIHKDNDILFSIGQSKDSNRGIYFPSDHVQINLGDWKKLKKKIIKLPDHWDGREYLIWDRNYGIDNVMLGYVKSKLCEMYDVYLNIVTRVESIKKESENQIRLHICKASGDFIEWHENTIRECNRLLSFYTVEELT